MQWREEESLDPDTRIYSALLHHGSLKRDLKVVLLRRTNGAKTSDALLFSTDFEIDAHTIVRYYKARFQIEFVFRDAKQGTGLTHCQARNAEAIHFHWNAALTALYGLILA